MKMPNHNGKQLAGGYFTYTFGDGWVAAVTVREVDAQTKRRLLKESEGFCGYDWMVDSILSHGKIKI